ncbi:MAG: AmmeMemoRadiSam system protein B [Thermogutta sp.]
METHRQDDVSSQQPETENPGVHATGVSVPEKPELSEEQRDRVLKAVARRVAEAVIGGPQSRLKAQLGEAGEIPVWGAFVTLKGAGGTLRACCGQVGDASRLSSALDAAADRTARWDLRFPAIQRGELAELTLEVWILWNCQPIVAEGESRVGAVEVGRHGLQVIRGKHRGLLLPGVAVEHHLDARQFLEHVCRKAGLPPNAWLDSATQLFTFEGYSLEAPMASLLPPELRELATGRLAMGDVVRLAALAHHNLLAMFQGATPNYYTSAAFDGPVQGVVLTINKLNDGTATERVMEASRVFPRGELPLQATLMDLLQTIVAGFRGQRLDPRFVGSLRTGLTVFVEPHHIGTAVDCALDGVHPRFHALCLVQDDRWAVRYDPSQNSTELFEAVMKRLKSSRPSQTQVYRLTALSTEDSVEASNVSRPVAGPSVRPPAVAGQFYPGTANGVDEFLNQIFPQNVGREEWAAALVPHAGWKYSGKLAAEVWARLRVPQQVIIFGPKHHAIGCDWAVTPHRTWALPGLSLHADPELAEALVKAVPLMELDAAAHAVEHSIEVQLPMVARVASASRVVGVVMHGGDYDVLQKAATDFAKFLSTLEPTPLLVISSDMNHYADERTTRRLDRLALDALQACDPLRLWKTVRENRISMCGLVPAVFVLETLRQMGRLNECEVVGYTTSGEVSGRQDRVVGYAGALFR